MNTDAMHIQDVLVVHVDLDQKKTLDICKTYKKDCSIHRREPSLEEDLRLARDQEQH
jgi:hypothetical protein